MGNTSSNNSTGDLTEAEKENLVFEFNNEKMTASLIRVLSSKMNIFIPRTITHEDRTYTITSIKESTFENARSVKSIQFPPDSELQTIESNALSYSRVEEILIPASVTKLEDEWCLNMPYLLFMSVARGNNNYKSIGKNVVLGKTDVKSGVFDELVFVSRYFTDYKIPKKVRKISSCAFVSTLITSINIPSNVRSICSYAFANQLEGRLSEVIINENSELQFIGESAFFSLNIEYIFIPRHVKIIGDCAFKFCAKLKKVEFQEGSELQTIGKNAFSDSGIEKIMIPKSVTKIGFGAFYKCKNLREVIFEDGSTIDKIESHAFTESSIEEFNVPQSVKCICKSAFFYCKNLENFNVPHDSDLQRIENNAFALTKIENIQIPSGVTELEDEWCIYMHKLNNVTVSNDNTCFKRVENGMIIGKSDIQSDDFDVFVVAPRNIKIAKIPPSIKRIAPYAFSESSIRRVFISSQVEVICDYAFYLCKKLTSVEFSNESKLKSINQYAFCKTLISKISIPSSVSKISEGSFYKCEKLHCIDFPSESELVTIEDRSLMETKLKSIFIPLSVTRFNKDSFDVTSFIIVECDKPFLMQIIREISIYLIRKTVFMVPC